MKLVIILTTKNVYLIHHKACQTIFWFYNGLNQWASFLKIIAEIPPSNIYVHFIILIMQQNFTYKCSDVLEGSRNLSGDENSLRSLLFVVDTKEVWYILFNIFNWFSLECFW